MEKPVTKYLTLKVNWLNERVNENDDNGGKHFGIYIFNCLKDEFDEEAGYGSYDVLDVSWFHTEEEREVELNKI